MESREKLVPFLSLKYKYLMNHQHLVTFSMLCSKKKYLNKKIIRWSVIVIVIVAQWVAELYCLLLLRLLIIIITNHSIFCLFCSKSKLSFAIASKSKLMELTLLTKNHWYTWEVEWPFNKFASWKFRKRSRLRRLACQHSKFPPSQTVIVSGNVAVTSLGVLAG